MSDSAKRAERQRARLVKEALRVGCPKPTAAELEDTERRRSEVLKTLEGVTDGCQIPAN